MFHETMNHMREVATVYRHEGLAQAVKYDFDRSWPRQLVPSIPEMIPCVLMMNNIKSLHEEAYKYEKNPPRSIALIKSGIIGMCSFGSEAARFLITSIAYNETKSPVAAMWAYTLTTGAFSFTNHLTTNRFYHPLEKRVSEDSAKD